MKIEIKNRWSGAVIFEAEISDEIEPRFRLKAAVELAVSKRADLRAADLRAADLSAADLRDADLRAADLSDADLRAADLRDADLRAADLSDADLRAADLSAANLRDAKNLTYDQLIPIRDDFWAVLSSAPREVIGLRQALVEGRVDGSTYTGECACLVGTIANVRGIPYNDLGALLPNSSRPAEMWFMPIKKGDTPDTNPHAKFALQWADEWLFAMREAFGEKAAAV